MSQELQIDLELRPVTGKKKTAFGEVDTQTNAIQIIVSNEFLRKNTGRKALCVGYANRKPGRGINWLPPARALPKAVRDVIASRVMAELHPDSNPNAEIKQSGPPPELPSGVTGADLGPMREVDEE